MNNILKEEIERFKLLSSYDNKKTLDENIEPLQEINWRSLLGLGAKESKSLAKLTTVELENLFRKIPSELSKFGNDAAKIIDNLKIGKFSQTELGELRLLIFKNTDDSVLKREIADDIVRSEGFKGLVNVAEKDALDSVKNAGFRADEAELLIKRYKNSGGKFTDEIERAYQKKFEKQRYDLGNKRKTSYKERIGYDYYRNIRSPRDKVSFLKIIAGTPKFLWTTLKLAAGLGIAYLIWQYYVKKGDLKYPKCLSLNIPTEDFEKMQKEGREHILNSDTGNQFIDSNEGGRFYENGRFETENEKYTGTWKEENGKIVVLLSNGEEHEFECVSESDFEDDSSEFEVETTPEPSFLSSITDSSVKSGMIMLVQRCLDLDETGIYSSEIEEKIGGPLTQKKYKEILKDCGFSSQESGYASTFTS
jgi:hypothetical protein